MGACLAVDEATANSRNIDKQNKKDFNAERRIVKLLLLGTGDQIPFMIENYSFIVNNNMIN